MVLDRKTQSIEHKLFKDIIDYLNPGDCLVINNTKVIPARLYGKKDTGAHVEVLLLKRIEGDIWEAMVRPGNKLRPGAKVEFGDGILKATILEVLEGGNRKVEFEYDGIFNEILDKVGMMPLPPYITEASREDNEKYQTVYAKYEGSAAAPTAGLHFTEELLDKIKAKGIKVANVTLHVGIGTFRPVKVEKVEDHEMHSEHYYIKKEDADIINEAKKSGHKIIAVGTTSCRVLESASDENGFVKEIESDTSIFIYPGYKFKCIDNLITNFHLPESTLIMLVSSLASREFILNAYNEAVKEKYKFFSFGDAMYIK
jgi:S-adenosylmethionine:tRNA ribosyltransferase-isomerase